MRLAALAAMAFALVPAAHAQSGCALIQKLVTSSATQFTDIRGEEAWDDSYEATIHMSGADECLIELRESVSYECSWVRKDGEAGKAWAASLAGAVAECLPAWTRADMTGRKTFNGLTVGSGVMFGGGNGLSVEAYHEVLDATETLVWFRVLKAA